jgi:hypothetical protein
MRVKNSGMLPPRKGVVRLRPPVPLRLRQGERLKPADGRLKLGGGDCVEQRGNNDAERDRHEDDEDQEVRSLLVASLSESEHASLSTRRYDRTNSAPDSSSCRRPEGPACPPLLALCFALRLVSPEQPAVVTTFNPHRGGCGSGVSLWDKCVCPKGVRDGASFCLRARSPERRSGHGAGRGCVSRLSACRLCER